MVSFTVMDYCNEIPTFRVVQKIKINKKQKPLKKQETLQSRMERGSWESKGKFWRWFSCRWAEDVWEEPLHREKPSHSNEMFFSEVGFYWLSSNKGGHERDAFRVCHAVLHDCSPSESMATLWGMKTGHMISNLITIKFKSMNQLRQ